MSASGFLLLLISAMIGCAAVQEENDRCQKPEPIKGAVLQGQWNDETYPPGKVAHFACLPDHTQDGPIKMACIEGSWFHIAKGQCKGFCVLDEGAMITHNIHYNVSTKVDHGQTITFQCKEGMMPENNLEAKCESGRIIYPKCTASKSCTTPEIKNGFLYTEPQDSYDSGSNVGFECNDDYVINGPIIVKCENGEWTELPVCYGPCKISTEDLTKRNIQLLPSDNNPDIPHRHGTRFSVSCKSGFRRPNQGALVIECSDGEFRYPRCFAGKTCRIDQDELDKNNLELDEVHDNEVYYEENERVHFKCKTGYYRKTKPIGKCSGETMIYPSCTATSCTDPPLVQNSGIDGQRKDKYVSGEKVTYVCNSGFALERSSTGEAICEDTHWKNIPVCRRISAQCGPPPVVQYGDTISFNKPFYRSGESVEYKCPEYYTLKGNRFVRCLNGAWDEAPVCLEPCTAKEKDMKNNNIRMKWSRGVKLYATHGDTMEFVCLSGYEASPGTQMIITCNQGKLQYPECFKPATSCTDPPPVQNSKIYDQRKDKYVSGEKVTYVCNSGFALERSSTGEAICEDTHWKNIPVCRRIGAQCGPPPVVQYGDTISFNKPFYRSGESVEYKCPEYYTLKGNRFVRCLNGAWDEAPVCLEPCTAKEKDMKNNNIRMKWSRGVKLYATHGDTMEFVCLSGYEAPPGTQMIITCNQGKLQYPECFKPV